MFCVNPFYTKLLFALRMPWPTWIYFTARGFLIGALPIGASSVVQMVKNLAAMPETQVQSLGREDPLEKEIANQSSILAWRIPWTEKPGGPQSRGSQRVRHN